MSDPKRATYKTVSAANSEKNKVNKTVRLTINLDESNESKYPELNYRELVIAKDKKLKKPLENGTTDGLHPFSDNDEDVERVARKFEQKYGSNNSSYGKKGRSKQDDFADIGAGYDENDSFIDNTDGYDEMIPPECDTLYGGFYINCGRLEFKNVPSADYSDGELKPQGRNKRRISSSSSSSQSSSSSDSDSAEENRDLTNGDRHEHRKKKIKKLEKAKKIRRTDSSAATSGKQTSDDNGHADSGESRTSQSDSLHSKPAPSSENAATSDSSRDVEARSEGKTSVEVDLVLTEMEEAVTKHATEPGVTIKDLENTAEIYIARLDTLLTASGAGDGEKDAALSRAARCLRANVDIVRKAHTHHAHPASSSSAAAIGSGGGDGGSVSTHTHTHKRKHSENDDVDISRLTPDQREEQIVETLERLKALIEERKPGMMAIYDSECKRVQEERKKMQIASADGAPHIEKRLPKRRFPWCQRTRNLLCRLKKLAGNHDEAALLLAKRALPLFPSGFVRMPTLLRQADLNKETNVSELKRQKFGSLSVPSMPTSQPQTFTNQPASQSAKLTPFTEPIQFPSSLTVTKTAPDKAEAAVGTDDLLCKPSNANIFGSLLNAFSLSKDLIVEKQGRKDTSDKKDDMFVPNNIGSITITPVPSVNSSKDNKKSSTSNDKEKEPMIRIKTPSALNNMVNKDKEKDKAIEKIHKINKDKHKSEQSRHNKNSERMKEYNSHLNPSSFKDMQIKEPTILIKHTYDKDSSPQIDLTGKDDSPESESQKNVRNKDSNPQQKDKEFFKNHSQNKELHSPKESHHHKDRPKDLLHAKDQSHNKESSHHKDSHKRDAQSLKDHPRLTDSQRAKETEIRIKEILSQVTDIPAPIKDISHKKRVNSPLHIETNFPAKSKEHRSPKTNTNSPKNVEGVTKKQIENMRVGENNIPRPALVPVHHSPTFAKPDKRPPDVKKKKDLLIIPDSDPLSDSDNQPVAIDDSSSDIEIVEDSSVKEKESVPLKNIEKVSDSAVKVTVDTSEVRKDTKSEEKQEKDTSEEDFDSLMKNIRDLEHSQESPKLNVSSNSYGGAITSAKRPSSLALQRSSSQPASDPPRDKFADRASLNKTDGCSNTDKPSPTIPPS